MSADAGLDGIVATDTVLSDVDGEAGRLVLRGYALEQLKGRSYEQVLQILLAGFVAQSTLAGLPAALGAAREEMFGRVERLRCGNQLLALAPIEALRALLAQLPDGQDDVSALRLIAATGVFTAAIIRARQGETPVRPNAACGHAADVLRMVRAAPATDCEVAALNRYLITVIDHGLNASTFAARVVASTHAGLISAVVAALSALKGPLHGGAPGPVLDMLDAIARPEAAGAWLEAALARGERLMGFGHRIYRVRDPRADALRAALQDLRATRGGGDTRLRLAEGVEQTALRLLRREKPHRTLETNVEFYTALLLEALGMPRDAFTCLFAVGRVGGWIAHAREQLLHGRLIRPQSRYVGPAPRRAA